MPTFTPPNFNVSADVWLPPLVPATSPPSFTAVACQPYVYSRAPQLMLHPGSGRWLPCIIIRLPFAFATALPPDSIFRIPTAAAFPTDYYKVQYVLRLHTGFTNQYYSLVSLQCNDNGTIPRTPLPT